MLRPGPRHRGSLPRRFPRGPPPPAAPSGSRRRRAAGPGGSYAIRSRSRAARAGRGRADGAAPVQTQRAPGTAVPPPAEASRATGPSPRIPEGATPRLVRPLGTRSRGAAAAGFEPRAPRAGRGASSFLHSALGRREGAEKAGSARTAAGGKCSGRPRSASSAPDAVRMAPAAPPGQRPRVRPRRPPPRGRRCVPAAHAAVQRAAAADVPGACRAGARADPSSAAPAAARSHGRRAAAAGSPSPSGPCAFWRCAPMCASHGSFSPPGYGRRRARRPPAHPPSPAPGRLRLRRPRRCAALL